VKITIDMESFDFISLLGAKSALDRFIPVGDTEEINGDYQHAYWYDSHATVNVACGYLEALGEPFQVLIDDCTSDDRFLILTDFDAYEHLATS
jgi:hypothetical protein